MPSGSRLGNVPRHSFNLLDTYEFAGGLAGLGLGVGLSTSAIAGQTSNNTFDMDGYGTVDLLAYYPLTENVRLNLNLNNVFDKHYEERARNAGPIRASPHPAGRHLDQPLISAGAAARLRSRSRYCTAS